MKTGCVVFVMLGFAGHLPAQSTETSYVYIPDTISEEAQAFLRMLPDPSLQPELPAPGDIDAWRAAQQEREAFSLERQKAIVADADKRQLGSDGKLPPTLEAELACSGPFRPKARLLPLISFSTSNGNLAPGRPNMRSCSDSGLAGGCLPGGGTEKALLSSCYPPRVEQPPLLVISIRTVNFDSSPTSSDWLSCSSENQFCFYKVNS